jgi:hypothetical protein
MFSFPAPRCRLSPLWIAGVVLAVLLQPAILLADELTAQKKTDIRRLMEVTGGANVAQQFASASSRNMFQMLKSARPDIPDRALEVMDRELMGLFKEKMSAPDGLFDQIVPIYHRHMTHAEIRQLIAFYETPIGRKTVAIMPQVVSESMQAGQRWGMSLGPEIERRIGDALVREGLVKPEDPK